jgi:hypothetical protein
VRYSAPNFPCELEIPDDWIIPSGINNFAPTERAYRSTPEAMLVALSQVIPAMREPSVPKDWRGFERERLLALLRRIVAGEQIDPVPLIQLPEPCPILPLPYRYSIRNGFHRFYASVIAGFSHLPASIETLAEVLQQSRDMGWRQ